MDLESTNGTYLNGNKIESARYYELLDKDVIKVGKSDREYVIMIPKVIKKKKIEDDEEASDSEKEEDNLDENNKNEKEK